MRLSVDDEVYRVDAVWLGPRNWTLPWRARYSAYGVGVIVFILMQTVERRVGVGLSFWVIMFSLLATVALTRGILALIDYERPLMSIMTAAAHEIGAPRAVTKGAVVRIQPGKLRVQDLPSPRKPWAHRLHIKGR